MDDLFRYTTVQVVKDIAPTEQLRSVLDTLLVQVQELAARTDADDVAGLRKSVDRLQLEQVRGNAEMQQFLECRSDMVVTWRSAGTH